MAGNIIPFTPKNTRTIIKKQKEIHERYSKEWEGIRGKFFKDLESLMWSYEDDADYDEFIKILDKLRYANNKGFGFTVNCQKKSEDHIIELEPIMASNGNWYLAVYTSEHEAKLSEAADVFDTVHVIAVNEILEKVSGNEAIEGICINPYDTNYCIIAKKYVNDLLKY